MTSSVAKWLSIGIMAASLATPVPGQTVDHDGQALGSKNGQAGSNLHEPYLRLSTEQLQTFVANAQTVRLGDTRVSVESRLGKPWSDWRMLSKEKGKFIGRFVRYYIVKYDKDLVNDRLDKSVTFRFDKNDLLTAIHSHIAEIPDLP